VVAVHPAWNPARPVGNVSALAEAWTPRSKGREGDADLKKQLPRIPFARDFWGFSAAGRELAHWHLNYETVEPWPLQQAGKLDLGSAAPYRVQKMAWGRKRVDGKLTTDKTALVYNSHFTLVGIPPEALDYIVNGKPALEWIIERYQVTTDKDSGIVNDPNDWAIEPTTRLTS
jgi:predicted helicase